MPEEVPEPARTLQMMQMLAGFRMSQALYVVAKVGLCTALETVMPPGDAPHPAKLMDLAMLGIVPGRERTAGEYEKLLADGGFTMERIVPSPTPFSFIEATLR
jgi:hypothetical protein